MPKYAAVIRLLWPAPAITMSNCSAMSSSLKILKDTSVVILFPHYTYRFLQVSELFLNVDECPSYVCLLIIAESLHKTGFKFSTKDHHFLKYLLTSGGERHQRKTIIARIDTAT